MTAAQPSAYQTELVTVPATIVDVPETYEFTSRTGSALKKLVAIIQYDRDGHTSQTTVRYIKSAISAQGLQVGQEATVSFHPADPEVTVSFEWDQQHRIRMAWYLLAVFVIGFSFLFLALLLGGRFG